jgi:hypothetical protein
MEVDQKIIPWTLEVAANNLLVLPCLLVEAESILGLRKVVGEEDILEQTFVVVQRHY